MKRRSYGWFLFLVGLFSQTQVRVIGSIAISELVMFLVAPYIFAAHYYEMRREKITTVLWLLILAMIGCVFSSHMNYTPFAAAIRGFATPYGCFACIICFWFLLRKDPMAFKWYLLGSAISFVLCTFVFQQAVENYVATGSGLDKASSDQIMSGPIYWLGRLGGFVMWPIQGFYLKTPLAFSAIGAFVFGAWAMLTTASGRSSALAAVASSLLILIGRKSQKSMRRLQRLFIPLCIGGVIFVALFKNVYTYSAAHGYLGEKAREKLENQTRGRTDLLHVIMGGRLEFFIGAYAALHHPIIGYGPWPEDREGLVRDFIARYASQEDYEEMLSRERMNARYGIDVRRMVPSHSVLIQFWHWYSILGLPFVLYLLYLVVDLLRKRIGAVPEFFGYFACILPSMLWGFFFSPFGGRIGWGFNIAMILLARHLDLTQERHSRNSGGLLS